MTLFTKRQVGLARWAGHVASSDGIGVEPITRVSVRHGVGELGSAHLPSLDATGSGQRPNPTFRAFTLLEVLIAVAAFAIVLAAINSVFFAALRLRNKTAEAFDESMALRHTVNLLRNDIANLLPPGGTLAGNLQTTPSTSASSSGSASGMNVSVASMALVAAASRPGQSSPEFYTTTGAIDETSPWSQVQKVSYFLTPSTNGLAGRDLVRSVTRNLLPTFQDQPAQNPILGGVESIFFQYHDGNQWKDTWDSTIETTRLPTAVRVQIQMAAAAKNKSLPPPIELVVPVMVYGGTNSTATTTTGGAQ